MELVEGKIIISGLSDYESEEIGTRLVTFLNNWLMSRKLGRVTGSGAGFILPSIEEDDSEKRNLRSPDVSFVRSDRLKKPKRDFNFEVVIELPRSWEYSKLGVPLTYAAWEIFACVS